MKKKKTQRDRKLERERELQRELLHRRRVMARFVAELIDREKDLPPPPLRSDDTAEDVQLIAYVALLRKVQLIDYLLAMLREVGPKFLRQVADAMEGKLWPRLKDEVREAYGKARNRSDRNKSDPELDLDQILNDLAIIQTKNGAETASDRESVRKELKALGYPMPETKRGRRPKSRPK